MSTRAFYHLREMLVDLADLPTDLYNEIASLHGHIDPPPAPPVLTCEGNGDPMYVYRHQLGRYFARHYKGGNPDGHSHRIATMSDGHRRLAEYSERAGVDSPAVTHTKIEHSTGNGTRLDLALFGENPVGFEIQRSSLSRAAAKARTAKSFDAGWPTAWVTDREKDPDWADHVPTARLTLRGVWDEGMPARNTAKVIISDLSRERDRSSRYGWRYKRRPRTVLLDELAYLMPAGEIIPVAIGTKGFTVLAYENAKEVIDSCTYPGASQWRPTPDTPRRKETAQRFSRECGRHTLDDPAPRSEDPAPIRESVLLVRCPRCQRASTGSVVRALGHCLACPAKLSER